MCAPGNRRLSGSGGGDDGAKSVRFPDFADGHPVTDPVLWISDEPVPDAGPLWASMMVQHPRTRLWPLLLTAAASGTLIQVREHPVGEHLAATAQADSFPAITDNRRWLTQVSLWSAWSFYLCTSTMLVRWWITS